MSADKKAAAPKCQNISPVNLPTDSSVNLYYELSMMLSFVPGLLNAVVARYPAEAFDGSLLSAT